MVGRSTASAMQPTVGAALTGLLRSRPSMRRDRGPADFGVCRMAR